MSKKKSKRSGSSPQIQGVEALVIRTVGSSHRVRTKEGKVFDALVRGKFRIANLQTTNPVAVGDKVMVSVPEEEEKGIIYKLIPRKNYLLRKAISHGRKVHILAANLDQAILIFTLKSPRTAPGFADRFLVVCEAYDIPAVIFINKADLLDTEEDQQLLKEAKTSYEQAGYEVHVLSALDSAFQAEVTSVLKDKVSFVGGHSGAGKSTMINMIDPSLQLKTSIISESSGKGTHTTTYAEMFDLEFGGAIIDSPGIKEWGLVEMNPKEIGHYFPEIRKRMHDCRFSDCIHKNEPACAVLDSVEKGEFSARRYEGYLRLLGEAVEDKEY